MFDPYGHSRSVAARRRRAPQGGDSKRDAPQGNAPQASTQRHAPTTGTSFPWHKRPAWKRCARELLRWYSRRSDFALRFTAQSAQPLASVSVQTKRVQCATEFPRAKKHGPANEHGASFRDGVRGGDALREAPTSLWLRGLLAHEAGHIVFSGKKPAESTLGWLWNALEDERMERLMARRHSELRPIFETMGDVMVSCSDEELREKRRRREEAEKRARSGQAPQALDVLNACLAHRWLYDHSPGAQSAFRVLPDNEFSKVQGLVEEAWEAQSSDEVMRIAREILRLFGIPEDQELPGGLEHFDLVPGASAGDDEEDTGDDDRAGDDRDKDNIDDEGAAPRAASGHLPRGGAPETPENDPEAERAKAGADLLNGQKAAIEKLSVALKPQTPSRFRRPHRSRGRFEYRRYAKGQSRVFSRAPERPEPPARITVLIDQSGSMLYGGRLKAAKKSAALLSGAAEMAGCPFQVISFTTHVKEHFRSSDPRGYETLRTKLTTLSPQEETILSPALQLATRKTRGAAGTHVVILISDGLLTAEDAECCARLYRKARAQDAGLIILPLLLGNAAGENEEGQNVYEHIFRRYAAIESPSELANTCARWLRYAA